MGVEMRRIAREQATKRLELPSAGRRDQLLVQIDLVEVDVEAEVEGQMVSRLLGGRPRRGPQGHQAGARHHTPGVCFDDSGVDAIREAQIIGVHDQR